MRLKDRSPAVVIGVAALLVVIGALAFALWQESRTETVEFQFGDQSLQIEAEG